MANTYININLHLIFAVKNRDSLIPPHWQRRVHSYISGILSEKGHIPFAVGGTDNHVHIFFSYKSTELLPDLVREIKVNTTKFINEHRITTFKFGWQSGYSCFSYARSQIEAVKHYIDNQQEHHNGRTFSEELRLFLDKFDIEYDEKYVMEDIGW